MTKRAFITGITGQDGSYLAELLLGKGYEVHGLIRRASTFNTHRIDHLLLDPHDPEAKLFLYYGDLSDGARLITLLGKNWGSGSPRRELLHVDDLAEACLHLMEHYDGPEQVNVGTGTDVTIGELAGLVSDAVGYQGQTSWDTSKPDGTPRKLLDVSRLTVAGWTPQIGLREGIESTVSWYRDHRGAIRQ